MSAHGEDIKITSDETRSAFPFSIEAKYKDKGLTSVYFAMEKAGTQVETLTSTLTHGLAAIQQQGKDRLIVVNMQDWLDLTQKLRALLANRERGVEPPPLKWSAPIVRKAQDQRWRLRDLSLKRLS